MFRNLNDRDSFTMNHERSSVLSVALIPTLLFIFYLTLLGPFATDHVTKPAKNRLWLDQSNELFEVADGVACALFQFGCQNCQGHLFSPVGPYCLLQFSVSDGQSIAHDHYFQVFVRFSHPTNLNERDECVKDLCQDEITYENVYSKKGLLKILPDSKTWAHFHLVLEGI